MGCAWEAPFLWLRGGLPSGFPTSWLMMGKVTCSIIFGNEHVTAPGQRQAVSILVSQELYLSRKVPVEQLALSPSRAQAGLFSDSWPSGLCCNSPGPSGFSHIWFKHATTQVKTI